MLVLTSSAHCRTCGKRPSEPMDAAGPSWCHTRPIDCIYLFILDSTSVAKNQIFYYDGFCLGKHYFG